MERVAILGPAGAGKSDLAAELARHTGLPVVHLDVLFWRPGWRPVPRAEARAALARALGGDRWILDGNFLDADDARLERADTVVFLDLPRRTCIARVLRRLLRDRRRTRPDLPAGCPESLDLPLLRSIWRYPTTDRPRVLALLAAAGRGGVEVHRLRSPREVRRYVESVLLR